MMGNREREAVIGTFGAQTEVHLVLIEPVAVRNCWSSSCKRRF
jgi:hypothetical protein